jgi:hypothetical protein
VRLGVRDTAGLVAWLQSTVLSETCELEHAKAVVYERCRELRIEPPTPERLDRIVRSAVHAHDEQFFARIAARLSPATCAHLDNLLAPPQEGAVPLELEPPAAVLYFLKADPGRACLESVQEELAKLKLLHAVALPSDLFAGVAPQACLVYINTLMVQQVLSAPAWMEQMGAAELRAPTPLISSHVTPCGTFSLDMETRLPIGDAVGLETSAAEA